MFETRALDAGLIKLSETLVVSKTRFARFVIIEVCFQLLFFLLLVKKMAYKKWLYKIVV